MCTGTARTSLRCRQERCWADVVHPLPDLFGLGLICLGICTLWQCVLCRSMVCHIGMIWFRHQQKICQTSRKDHSLFFWPFFGLFIFCIPFFFLKYSKFSVLNHPERKATIANVIDKNFSATSKLEIYIRSSLYNSRETDYKMNN